MAGRPPPFLLAGFPTTSRQMPLLREAIKPARWSAVQLQHEGETEEAVRQQMQRLGGEETHGLELGRFLFSTNKGGAEQVRSVD